MPEQTNVLHQLLAVKDDLEKKAQMILNETETTFTKRQDHFDGVRKNYVPKEEGGEQLPSEAKEIVTTVADKLDYTKQSVIKAIDARLSLEETNASGTANAEVVLEDGTVFGTFSSISLLALEDSLSKIRAVYKNIPTLDPAQVWNSDPTQKNVYRTNEEVKFRVIKRNEPLVLYPATDKHPAQTQVVTNDVQVGRWVSTSFSGRISPLEKSNLLQRVDDLIIAVKKAKAKANQVQAIQVKVGEKLFNYINGVTS